MTPEQEIRAKALELAIMAAPSDVSSAEFEDLAKDFAGYITGNADEPTELGFYRDREDERWERTADGWHFREHGSIGMPETWEDIRHYAPFTKVED